MVVARPTGLNRKQRRELARRLRVEDPGLEVMNPDAAGIDISTARSTSRSGRIGIPIRSVGSIVSPRTCIGSRTGYSTVG
jgi:hypothetical protein